MGKAMRETNMKHHPDNKLSNLFVIIFFHRQQKTSSPVLLT